MLSDADLNAIEGRLKFYDDEYWKLHETDRFQVAVTNRQGRPMPPLLQDNKFARDEIATFVAHAPEDVRNLLDEVERLRDLLRIAAEHREA